MHKQIFVNLPIKNVERTRAFFTALGYRFNPQFSDDNALCLILGDNLFAMLLQEAYFQTFTNKKVADGTQTAEVLIALSCDSRQHVDDLIAKAVAAGGHTPHAPKDYGFMYYHEFQDLDGHVWELTYMDPNAAPPNA